MRPFFLVWWVVADHGFFAFGLVLKMGLFFSFERGLFFWPEWIKFKRFEANFFGLVGGCRSWVFFFGLILKMRLFFTFERGRFFWPEWIKFKRFEAIFLVWWVVADHHGFFAFDLTLKNGIIFYIWKGAIFLAGMNKI